MAYVLRGCTDTELRQRWQEEAHQLSPEAILVRFGKPPYRWLGETTASAPTNDTPTYSQQARPLLVDQHGRQYTPVGADDPMAANIRLPMGITRQQRDPRSRVPTSQIQAFPRVGETVELAPLVNRRPAAAAAAADPSLSVSRPAASEPLASSSSAVSSSSTAGRENVPPTTREQSSASTSAATPRVWVMRVRGLENVRTATGRVLFHQRLPTRQEIETPAVAAQRDRALDRRLNSSSSSSGGGPPSPLLSSSIDSPTAEGRALRRFLAIDSATTIASRGIDASMVVAGAAPLRKRSAAQALGV